MPDIFDAAQATDQLNLAQALDAQHKRAALARRPAARGHCLHADCEEPFSDPNRLFCGPACAQAYERDAARLPTK